MKKFDENFLKMFIQIEFDFTIGLIINMLTIPIFIKLRIFIHKKTNKVLKMKLF